jgi:hypothetical protein
MQQSRYMDNPRTGFQPDNHLGGIVKRNLLLIATTLLLAGCASEATAPVMKESNATRRASTNPSVLLFDTGPGGPGGFGTIDLFAFGSSSCSPQPACGLHFQFLGGQFTLANDATIDGVQGWMETSAGSMDVHIRADASGRPGTDVYSQNYSMSAQSVGWAVFSNFNVSLPAGTYWVTFEPVANGGIQGSMPGGAANPLASYAFLADGNLNWGILSAPALGFRISGSMESTITPSQNITQLMGQISALGLAGGIATSANAKLQAALNAITASNTVLACSSLQDEINFVTAQSGKKIPASDASTINTSVAAIRTQLGC